MKSGRSILAAAALALATWTIGFAQSGQPSAVRAQTFEKVWRTVNEKYWDPTFGGIDWKAVHERYSQLVAAARSDDEFSALMSKMLGLLKTSHLEILGPEYLAKMKQPPVIVGVGLQDLEGQVVITRVIENTAAAEAGLKFGYSIKKIDGIGVKNADDARSKLRGEPHSKFKLSYTDESEAEREVTLERRTIDPKSKSKIAGVNFYGVFEQERIGGDIGHIRFSNFLEFLNPQIRSAIESMHDAKGLIIDLRGNSGGDDSVAVKMASLFFEKETLLMITKTRKGDVMDYRAKANKDPFKGTLVILIDENSRSASEQFAAGMQESGRAVVIGKTSAGADMDGELEPLPDGSLFLYAVGQPRTPKGFVVEGRGVKPNIEISLLLKDLRGGKDDQLEAAIEYIRTHKQ